MKKNGFTLIKLTENRPAVYGTYGTDKTDESNTDERSGIVVKTGEN